MSASVGVGQSSWVWVGWQDPHPWWKPILSPQQPSVTSNSSAKYRTSWALVYSCWDFDWIDLVRVLFMYSQPPCVHIHSVPVMTGNHCPMVTHHCLWLLESFHPLLQWPLSSRKRTVIDMAFRTGYSIADISISLIKKKPTIITPELWALRFSPNKCCYFASYCLYKWPLWWFVGHGAHY